MPQGEPIELKTCGTEDLCWRFCGTIFLNHGNTEGRGSYLLNTYKPLIAFLKLYLLLPPYFQKFASFISTVVALLSEKNTWKVRPLCENIKFNIINVPAN